MKKILYFTAALSIALFASCKTDINEAMYYATVGKNSETTPPGEVIGLRATPKAKSVTLNWSNPDDFDLSGITISVTPAAGSLAVPVTYKKSEMIKIPTVMNVTGLAGGVNYTFKITTFDYNNNKSNGVSVSSIAEGDASGGTANFDGNENLFTYKKDLTAFDFGYCASTTDKVIALTCTSELDLNGTYVDSNVIGSGSFSLVSISKMNASVGDNISITVRYNAPASSTPSWDESDLVLGGNANNRIRLIASNYKQPKDVKSTVSEKDYGLKLWLRADMITSSDIISERVTRIPDYSGRNLHAYNTSVSSSGQETTVEYAPIFKPADNNLNNLPSIDFYNTPSDTKSHKSQFLSMGSGANPIINSPLGSTTFIVMVSPYTGTTQTIISSNYAQSYPTLIQTARYISPTGYSTNYTWGYAVKGSGLQGTYRYPCISNDLEDENNKWLALSDQKKTSVCMRFDQNLSYKFTNRGDGGVDYPSNIRMQVDGKERLLAYIHSNKESTLYKDYTASSSSFSRGCYGAYGKPLGDGKGHRYKGLSQKKIPTNDTKMKECITTPATADPNELTYYNNWLNDRGSGTRPYDYAYSFNPYEWEENPGFYNHLSANDGSYASSDAGKEEAYFNNWISTEERRNGSIYSVIIGADNVISSVCKARIAEVIMFDYALSDEEIEVMNNYIYNRYKIVASD